MNSKNIICIAAIILGVKCCASSDPKKDDEKAKSKGPK